MRAKNLNVTKRSADSGLQSNVSQQVTITARLSANLGGGGGGGGGGGRGFCAMGHSSSAAGPKAPVALVVTHSQTSGMHDCRCSHFMCREVKA